jgi:hypothetical protein
MLLDSRSFQAVRCVPVAQLSQIRRSVVSVVKRNFRQFSARFVDVRTVRESADEGAQRVFGVGTKDK